MDSPVARPALRYHGAKFRLAPWIMTFFPEHKTYVEPFGGAAGVLLQKPRAYAEVYNDLDGDVVNFFRVLRDDNLSKRLIKDCYFTPYAREDFDLSWQDSNDPVDRARRLAIRAQMGFGSAGATKGTTGFRVDTTRDSSTAQHLWATYPEALEAAAERLRGVLIENRSAIEVMRQHDSAMTLHFVDPPYLHSTRSLGSNRYYRHEMDDAEHADLLNVLLDLQGMVVISGYPSELYNSALCGWQKNETQSSISANRGSKQRTEVVWLNPACAAALEDQCAQKGLF